MEWLKCHIDGARDHEVAQDGHLLDCFPLVGEGCLDAVLDVCVQSVEQDDMHGANCVSFVEGGWLTLSVESL